MSRRRGSRRMPPAELLLLAVVVALGVALYGTAGAGPVALAVVASLILAAFTSSRASQPGRRRRR